MHYKLPSSLRLRRRRHCDCDGASDGPGDGDCDCDGGDCDCDGAGDGPGDGDCVSSDSLNGAISPINAGDCRRYVPSNQSRGPMVIKDVRLKDVRLKMCSKNVS